MIRYWLVFIALLFVGAGHPARVDAQTLEKWIGAAGRSITKSLQGGTSSRRAKSRRGKNVVIPPLPIRRPLPWQNETAQSNRDVPQTQESSSPPRRLSTKTPKQNKQILPTQKTTEARDRTKTAPPAKKKARVEKSWPKTLAQAKAEKAEQERIASGDEKPAEDQWSDVEVNIAQARCRHLLKQVDAVTIAEAPIKKGPCGDAAPIRLVSIGQNPQVSISPPATLNCSMVFALHSWLEKDLQPLAQKHLGSQIIQIENISSYSCRNAYGRKNTRLSEHARANALDIRGFVTANGKRTRLLAHWGPVERDVVAARKRRDKAEKAAAEKAKKLKAAKTAQKETDKKSGSETKTVGSVKQSVTKTTKRIPTTATNASELGLKPTQLGGPQKNDKKNDKKNANKSKIAADEGDLDPATIKIPKPSWSPKAKFLKHAHKRACKIFGTVLGPESNEPHRNHFHVDLAERKRSNFCE